MPPKKAGGKAKAAAKHAADSPSRKKKGAGERDEKEIAEAVGRILREKFGHKSEREVDGILVAERTLRGTLIHDKKEWYKNPKAVSMGPGYYCELDRKFTEDLKPYEMLTVDDKHPSNRQPLQQDLMNAIGMCQLTHPNRGKLIDWMLKDKQLGQKDRAGQLKKVFIVNASEHYSLESSIESQVPFIFESMENHTLRNS